MNQNLQKLKGKTMEKQKMTKDVVPEGFSLSLAAVDALPVLLFCASIVALGMIFNKPLFLTGSLLCFWAGTAKVLWKIIVVIKKRNVWWLFLQMRTAMPMGLFMIVLSLIINNNEINMTELLSAVLSFPSVVFFSVGLLGMILMGIFAVKLDSSKVKSNWIEQITNAAAQASFFIGIILVM